MHSLRGHDQTLIFTQAKKTNHIEIVIIIEILVMY